MDEALPSIGSIDSRFCPKCWYDLRTLSSDRCPECGLPIDHAALATSRIPWTHRAKIGRVRAYLQTIFISVRHPTRLAEDIGRPVDLDDALKFRRVTTALAALPFIVILTVCLVIDFKEMFLNPGQYWAELLGLCVAADSIWLFFLTMTGVGSYWFHPRGCSIVQQNRAIAISYYAAGPLGLTGIALVLMGAIFFAHASSGRNDLSFMVEFGLVIAIVGLLLFEVAAFISTTVILLRRTTQCGVSRALGCAVGVPVAWLCLAGLFLFALPASYFVIALMILSFR